MYEVLIPGTPHAEYTHAWNYRLLLLPTLENLKVTYMIFDSRALPNINSLEMHTTNHKPLSYEVLVRLGKKYTKFDGKIWSGVVN